MTPTAKRRAFLIDEYERLNRLLDLERREDRRFARGEAMQRAAVDHLGDLLNNQTIVVPLPPMRIFPFNRTTNRPYEEAWLRYRGVPDVVPGDAAHPLLRLAISVSKTKRVCVIRADTEKWVMWMRSDPPGEVDEDVALYLKCRDGVQFYSTATPLIDRLAAVAKEASEIMEPSAP